MSSKLSEQEYQKAVQFTFKHFDRNASGTITKQEFQDLLGAIAPRLNFPINEQLLDHAFRIADRDQDGLIGLQELHVTLAGYYYK